QRLGQRGLGDNGAKSGAARCHGRRRAECERCRLRAGAGLPRRRGPHRRCPPPEREAEAEVLVLDEVSAGAASPPEVAATTPVRSAPSVPTLAGWKRPAGRRPNGPTRDSSL